MPQLRIFFALWMVCVSKLALADAPSVVVKVDLYPIGSFEATSAKVIGKGIKSGVKYAAKELKVPIATIKTGNSLRDKHMREKLKAKEFPFVVVKDITAEKSAGKAKITIMNTTKDIKFDYKELSNNLAEATFKLNLKDFKIEGINYKGVGVEDEVEVIAKIAYDKK